VPGFHSSTSLANLLPPTYGLTVVVSLAVLLLVSGSTGSTAATDAVLVTVPFLVARTTIAAVADPPSPRSPAHSRRSSSVRYSGPGLPSRT